MLKRLRLPVLALSLFVLSLRLAYDRTIAAMDDDPNRGPTADHLREAIAKVQSLHKRLGPPQPGDWLDQHEEKGQTFADYLAAGPMTARGRRRVIYVQPIGEFTASQRKIVDTTAEFLKVYFNLRVVVQKTLPPSVVPAEARRTHPSQGMEQLLTTHILDRVLFPRLPDDAAALIAFTSADLWPGEGWSFVFGQASLRQRVGVWSIYRNGDPDKSKEEFRLCLKRTLKTAVHETGHMFSIAHCTLYSCNMCGSNNQDEADRQPLYLCPECMAKVCWATATYPLTRERKLTAFCASHGLEEERAFYEKSAARLAKKGS